MKKTVFALTLLCTLGLAATALAGSFNLAALEAQAARAVPQGQKIASGADELSAFVSLQTGKWNYQFTLSTDKEPGMTGAQPLVYKGQDGFFFEPGIPGSGGLMILLNCGKTLTILCMPSQISDAEISLEDMTAIADRMDLGALK
jgi:hypothetical protein